MERKKVKYKNISQLLIALIAVVGVSMIGSFLFVRLDLTSEKRYTLTKTTKDLLKNLDDVVYVQIFLEGEDLPIGFKRLQKSVKEMLDEFSIYGHKNIKYEFINPFENKDNQAQKAIFNELRRKGLQPTDLNERSKEGKTSQKIIFPAALMTYKGREVPVNLLKNSRMVDADENLNNSIQSLEYEFTNAVRKLSREKPPRIAFVTGHGELPEKNIRDMAYTLSEYYWIEQCSAHSVDSLMRYSAIIFAKPTQKFSEEDKFAIDQYVMQGGKVLWFIDAVQADMDSIYMKGSTIAYYNPINLDDQLFHYGVRINPALVQDVHCASIGVNTASPNEAARIKPFPWLYYPLLVSQNNHAITKYLNVIMADFANTIDTVGESSDVRKTILLSSSEMSKVIPVNIPMPIKLDMKLPSESSFMSGRQNIAVLLEGNFESVFKNRNTNPLVQSRGSKFKDKSVNTSMIVVADGDMIRNDVGVKGEMQPLGYNKNTRQFNSGNKEFILNALNYLCDDEGLMNIRLREIKMRLLDKAVINEDRTFWQLINTVLPIVIVILFGLIMNYLRKRKYNKI